MCRLTKKLALWTAFGLAVGILTFAVLFKAGNYVLGLYFETSSFRATASADTINDLQQYVNDNHISATDTYELQAWAAKKDIGYFTVSRERMLLYDNFYNGDVPLWYTESDQLHDTWENFVTVHFEDGDADVFIYSNLEKKYYVVFYIACGILSALVCLVTFVSGIRRHVLYIKKLSQEVAAFEKDSSKSNFTEKGDDEITDLAKELNHMRHSLAEKEQHEKDLKSSQNRLLLGMAHDLRTPLTGQMAYLELAKRQNVPESAACVDKALEKSVQIKNLSDQLFDIFLLESDMSPNMGDWENVGYVFEDYLSEMCNLLENSGFVLQLQDLLLKDAEVCVCYDYIGRIMDNVSSNITKYADQDSPVMISALYVENAFGLSFSNTIPAESAPSYGAGVGLDNINSMMERMGGRCEFGKNEGMFSITLWFPTLA